MKLNPPETAPRNGMAILAFFQFASEVYPRLLPAAWDGNSMWCFCENVGHDEGVWFDVSDCSDDGLLGWLPMPKIDEEGNVTWPSE